MIRHFIAPFFAVIIGTFAFADSFKNLGPQITSVTIQGAAFTHAPDGTLLACAVMRAVPARLIVVEAMTGRVRDVFPLEHAHGGWGACTNSSGDVFIPTDNEGHLYRYNHTKNSIDDLGQVLGQSFLWSVCAGDEGEIFGGTYPDGKIFRYRDGTGIKDVGTVVPGEQYCRSVSYNDGKIYGAIGSHAHLVEVDAKSRKKRELLPKEFQTQDFAYCVSAVSKYLLVAFSPSNSGVILDARTGQILKTVPNMSLLCKAVADSDGNVYFSGEQKLWQWTPSGELHELAPIGGALAMTIDSGNLIAIRTDQKIVTYDLQSHRLHEIAFNAPELATLLQSVRFAGGKIYVGGYLSGGAAVFDPRTNQSKQLGEIPQPEDISSIGSDIYFGGYPHARLYRFDSTEPWGRNNPKMFVKIEGQSRPMAMLGVPQLNKLFFGTVPEYGHLGGVLGIYDPQAGKIETFEDVVHNQSIVSLVYKDGQVIGGTSIWGGLGQQPSEKAGKLFVWDVKQNKKVFEQTPVAGKPIVSGLFVGPDKNVWGAAGNTLFIFDPSAQKVIFTKVLVSEGAITPHSEWRNGRFVIHPNGYIYCAIRGQLLRIDPRTKAIHAIRSSGVDLLTMDQDGKLYFKNGIDLWQYAP